MLQYTYEEWGRLSKEEKVRASQDVNGFALWHSMLENGKELRFFLQEKVYRDIQYAWADHNEKLYAEVAPLLPIFEPVCMKLDAHEKKTAKRNRKKNACEEVERNSV